MSIEDIIKQNPTIVDVRTSEEFSGGNVPGSINIPLQELHEHVDRLKNMKQPLVLCCASGGRSGMATQILMQNDIECWNGGSWLNVNYYKSQEV